MNERNLQISDELGVKLKAKGNDDGVTIYTDKNVHLSYLEVNQIRNWCTNWINSYRSTHNVSLNHMSSNDSNPAVK